MKYRYSVQFERPANVDTLIEFLRYAQILSINDDESITIHCPAGIGRPENWARSNVERIRSFSFTAAVCRKEDL